MIIHLLMVGKTSENFIAEGFQLFIERLSRYLRVTITEIQDIKNRTSLSNDQIKEKEALLIEKHIPSNSLIILLDEKGKEFSSAEFSRFVQQQMNAGFKHICFIIGGAYGVSNSIKYKANHIISLSRMTFTHQMIRVILAEQLYRAMTIINHEPYHNE